MITSAVNYYLTQLTNIKGAYSLLEHSLPDSATGQYYNFHLIKTVCIQDFLKRKAWFHCLEKKKEGQYDKWQS